MNAETSSEVLYFLEQVIDRVIATAHNMACLPVCWSRLSVLSLCTCIGKISHGAKDQRAGGKDRTRSSSYSVASEFNMLQSASKDIGKTTSLASELGEAGQIPVKIVQQTLPRRWIDQSVIKHSLMLGFDQAVFS